MDYKQQQKMYREMNKPKEVSPDDYTDHDKQVAENFTRYFSRAQRRKKVSNPKYTKKYKAKK